MHGYPFKIEICRDVLEDFVRAFGGAAPPCFPSSASREQAQLMDRMQRAAAEDIAT